MRRIFWGILVVLVGLWIWAGALNLPEQFRFSRNWPILIVLLGAYIVFRSVRRRARRRVRRVDVISELEQGKIDVDEAVDKIRRQG